MEVMMLSHQRPVALDYSEESARTVEVIREENDHGELGSFGFTLLYEKPSIIGSIVPGGPAERAGLHKNDIVIRVNGSRVTGSSHAQVVGLIYNTPNAGVWLSVCDPPQEKSSFGYGSGPRINFHMSQSTPMLQGGGMSAAPRHRYRNGDNPPRYDQVGRMDIGGGGGGGRQLGNPVVASSVHGISPLKRKVLTQSMQNGRQMHNGQGGTEPRSSSPAPPRKTSTTTNQASISVLVLYIGPVEIPESWSSRGLSSKCIQECTRRLLSQRHDFIEVYLEFTTAYMRILNISRTTLVKHRRDELYYSGICTDDEQYFAIVTQKSGSKSSQLVIDPEVGQAVPSDPSKVRANICHVFKVITAKSVMVLNNGGERKKSGSIDRNKTFSISSSMVVINAIKTLFAGEELSLAKLGGSTLFAGGLQHSIRVGPVSSSVSTMTSSGSSESAPVSGNKSPQSRRKKLDVFDLRTSFSSSSGSVGTTGTTSSGYSTPNVYMVDRTPFRGGHALNREVPNHPMATPAFLTSTTTGGGKWYSTSSPKEGHARQDSWESGGRPVSGNFDKYVLGVGGGRGEPRSKGSSQDRLIRKVSEDSLSSLSSSRTPSPSKLMFRSATGGRSRSPSPARISYSSGSRSHSPSPPPQIRSPSPQNTLTVRPSPLRIMRTPSGALGLSASLALETSSIRSGAMSPVSSILSQRSGRMTLRRQGSENSIMEMQQAQDQLSQIGLPQRNGIVSSSIGSIATLATLVDEVTDLPDDVGRVAGWIGSFDKLLADPLGVQCLQQLLEKERSEENLLFWRDAEEFRKTAQQMHNMQAAAKRIFDQFLSPSASHPINVDDRVQKAVEQQMGNPLPNIFHEAQEQIYQLMKMDCYPRFKKSELVKQCLLAEMEGRALPCEAIPEKKSDVPQGGASFNWKKSRPRESIGRSLFSRLRRREIPVEHPLRPSPSWEPPSPDKKKKAGKKEDGGQGKKEKGTRAKGGAAEDVARADEFPPENNLGVLQAHKGNIFEINLPNKVTKILEVPSKGTVRDAIRPTLKKYGYPFDIMELRSASTFRCVDMDAPSSILVGQHMVVIKSSNTFTAAFPDGPEKILSANGKKTIGEVFASVMKEIGKAQSYAVYLEGSRVPLELNVDASVLVGQRVTVKYVAGGAARTTGTSPVPPRESKSVPRPPSSAAASSSAAVNLKPAESSSDYGKDVDDLISMICRLANDKLDEQRTSPSPRSTPEPGSAGDTSPAMPRRSSPEAPREALKQAQKQSPSSGSFDSPDQAVHDGRRRSGTQIDRKLMQYSRSSDVLDRDSRPLGTNVVDQQQLHTGQDGERGRERVMQLLRPTAYSVSSSSMRSKFQRTQSGVHPPRPKLVNATQPRSFSPPADLSQRNASPPLPTADPPPLPPKTKRFTEQRKAVSGSEIGQGGRRKEDWDATRAEQLYASRDTRVYSSASGEVPPQYFPKAHPSLERNHPPLSSAMSNPLYANPPAAPGRSSSGPYGKSPRGTQSPSSPPPPYEYQQRLDSFVQDASSTAPGVAHQRQSSAPVRNPEFTSSGRQLQSTARPPMQHTSSGANLSSYPWHQAHPQQQQQQQQQRRHSANQPAHMIPRSMRKKAVENAELMSAGEKLMQREISEFRLSSSPDSCSSGHFRTTLSPTTHMLVVTDDDDSVTTSRQRETFV